MADHTVGDGVVGCRSNLQAYSGDSELDEKIAEWLHLDKVTYSFPNIKHSFLPHTYVNAYMLTCTHSTIHVHFLLTNFYSTLCR